MVIWHLFAMHSLCTISTHTIVFMVQINLLFCCCRGRRRLPAISWCISSKKLHSIFHLSPECFQCHRNFSKFIRKFLAISTHFPTICRPKTIPSSHSFIKTNMFPLYKIQVCRCISVCGEGSHTHACDISDKHKKTFGFSSHLKLNGKKYGLGDR